MPRSANTADEYDFVGHEETQLSPQDLAIVRDWLQPTDYLADSGEFRRHLSSQAPGTGLWICQTEEYRKWHSSPDHSSNLWIKGIPGAGKSVIAASIVQHLRTTEDYPVLFFFFRDIVVANSSPRALIQDWLAQLLPHSPKLQFAVQSRLKTKLEETSDNDLVQLFLDGISYLPRVYCVADALDEMTLSHKPFLEKLSKLATSQPQAVKLLITSRPKQYLQSAFQSSPMIHISLQEKLVNNDILCYLNHRFHEAPKFDSQHQIKQQIVDMIARRSNGLFLYAKLTMDQVEARLSSDTLVDVTALEASLPSSLEQTYDSVLARQRKEHGISTKLQVLILQAITHAARPLRLNELASLTKCIYPDLDEPAGFKALVATSCGPLVEILEDETLQVIHHSFTEFLRGDTRNATSGNGVSEFPVINSEQAHKEMTLACLAYLQSGSMLLEGEAFATGDVSITFRKPSHQVTLDEERRERNLGSKQEKDPFDYREARLIHPFLAYAAENWPYHCSHYDVDDGELFLAIEKFLNPSSLAFHRWLVLQWGSTSKARGSTEGVPQAIHIAAFSGLSRFILKLIQQGSSVSSTDSQDRIPLHWAASNGHATVVSLLIQHGSDPNAEDAHGLKPIHLAAKKNHALVVTVLLEAGVEPDTIKTKENHRGYLIGGEEITTGECSILYATVAGHLESIVAMIPFCKPNVLEKLLCQCCRYNRTDAALAVLERSDVSADAMFEEATALFFACKSANVKIVEALIRRGADVGKTSTWKPRVCRLGPQYHKQYAKAPLHCLVQGWGDENNSACQEIFQLLVKAKVDIEQVDANDNSPLLIAAAVNIPFEINSLHVHALRHLLEAGADATKTIENGDASIHLVLQGVCNLEAVKLLIEHGIDPNLKGEDGKTPLSLVVERNMSMSTVRNQEAIIKYLVEASAKVTSTIVKKSMSVSFDIFQQLLPHCENESVKRQCWFSLAWTRLNGEFSKFLRLFLSEGIDIETKDNNGCTLYLCCLGKDVHLETLRSHGAKTNVVDKNGNNALHILGRREIHSHDRMAKLIADGLNPLSTNNNGDTLLHLAARWYSGNQKSADYVRWLIGLGIPINAVNKMGKTALHEAQRACQTRCHEEAIHFVQAINCGHNIDLELRDENGMTVLHTAATDCGIDLKTLIDAGAEVDALTDKGQNVLHLACRARKHDILGRILDSAESCGMINQKDNDGRTPLFWACSTGQAESVSLLLERGADPQIVDRRGRTTLHACAEFKLEQNLWDMGEYRCRSVQRSWAENRLRPDFDTHQHDPKPWYVESSVGQRQPKPWGGFSPQIGTIIRMLIDADCNISAVDSSRRTALDVALKTGCSEFSEVFAEDESLFSRATANLEVDKYLKNRADKLRHMIKAQILLTRPKYSLKSVSDDKLALEAVLKSPARFLNLLTPEDAAKVINERFEACPNDEEHYVALQELMESDHLQVVEQVSSLVLHYSSEESLGKMIERARASGEEYYQSTAMTPLQMACRRKEPNMLMLRLLVEKLHVDVNAHSALLSKKDYQADREMLSGGTALHILADASFWWQREAMNYLLEKGAIANSKNENEQTPLHIASKATGKRTAVEYEAHQVRHGIWRYDAALALLNHGADLNALDKKHRTPLHVACASPEVLRELLRRGADTSLGRMNPLFQAIYDQSLGGLEALLDHGLDVNSVNEKSHTLTVNYSRLTESRMQYAVVCTAFSQNINTRTANSMPLLRVLVERGADLYRTLNDKETLIHFLFEIPDYEVLDELLKEPCASRIDFNRRDQRGRTVLMAVCDWHTALGLTQTWGRWEPQMPSPAVRILDLGGDATAVDDEGKTALHHILDNPCLLEESLLEFIERPEVAPTLFKKDKDGFLPYHYALRLLRPKVCELLLSKGADILEPDPDGLTTLHHIADQCLRNTLKPRDSPYASPNQSKDFFDNCLALWNKFIEEGGSISVCDKQGNAPLLRFLLSPVISRRRDEQEICHVESYDKLFPPDSGVDIFTTNHAGETALHIISRREKTYYTKEGHDKALFEAMMAKGLDPLKEDAKGRSALDVADACGKDDIVAIVRRK